MKLYSWTDFNCTFFISGQLKRQFKWTEEEVIKTGEGKLVSSKRLLISVETCISATVNQSKQIYDTETAEF